MSKEKKIIKLTGKQLGKVCGGKVDFPNKIGTDGGCSKLVFSQCCQITVYLDT